MSYKITAQVYQTNPNAYFRVVEKTVCTDGTWAEVDGAYVLTMGSSGTCGSLRFASEIQPSHDEENFVITLGVHNCKCWGDIVTTLANDSNTGVLITPHYYSDQYPDMVQQREAQLVSYKVKSDQGRNFSFIYTVAEGSNLTVKIIIG